MRILILSDSSRELYTHTPDLLALAFQELKHEVELWHKKFFHDKPLGYIELPKSINDKFDMVIYVNSRQQIIDLSEIVKPIRVFLYYELYCCPTVPKGTEVILTSKLLKELLIYANYEYFMEAKIINLDLAKPMVAPIYWLKGNNKKDIDFRYNGNLTNQADVFILNDWMSERIDFMKELKNICSDLELPKETENYYEWKNRFYRTKINVHISSKHGVGQGAYESALAECCLIEYPKTNIARKEGLRDGVNCFLVSTPSEAMECYNQLKDDLKLQEQFNRELLKVAYRHTYKMVKPRIKLLLNRMRGLRT